ncbi:MAG: GNAT family N-acetyltransferase [Actinomycetota bacterium]|nr:GNAT family N-acetyltransferase [Actinomycetota bacterium]
MKPVLCVVQARTGSTRLPGKVLQDLGGRPMLRFMLERLRGLDHADVVVATSDLDRDDIIEDVARMAGFGVVRGPEADVLARFVGALDATHPAEHVIRLTADCPLTDPDLVAAVLARHLESGADYTANVFPRTFPKGLDVEVMTRSALLTAHTEATDPGEREHVTPFLYRRPERFRLANLRNDAWLGREWWTVDTADDLEFIRALVARMGGGRFSWRDAWNVMGPRAVDPVGAIVLEPASREHCDFVLACRNDDDAVRWSTTGRVIPPTEHRAWYRSALDDPGIRLRVASVDGTHIGTVRADVRGGVGEVGIAVAAEHRGRGHGRAMLIALVADCAGDPQVVTLDAGVHGSNTTSLRAFEAVGFVTFGERDGFRLLRRPVQEPIQVV